LTETPETPVFESAQDYTLTSSGQEVLKTYVNYYLKRAFLKPERERLIREIQRDNPDMNYKERLKIVGQIISKVKEIREASE